MFNVHTKMPKNLINSIAGIATLLLSTYSVANPQIADVDSASSDQLPFIEQMQTAKLEIVSNARVLNLPTLSLPLQSAKLFSRVAGFINARYVDIGDEVRKNDVLATIDEPQITAQENKILADIDVATAQLELAQLNAQRAERLVSDRLISAAERDKLRILRSQASAKIASLQAQLEGNRVRQSFLKIRAPFDGYIIARNLELGDLVGADTIGPARHLFEIANTRRMRLNIHVPQNEIRFVATGDEVSATFTGYPDLRVKGHISRLSHAVNAQSGTMLIEAEFDNSAYNLPAGLRGTVSLNISSDANENQVFRAPLSAISYYNGHDAVVSIHNGQVAFHVVEIVAKSQNSVLLKGDLNNISKVVLNPNALLKKDA